MVEFYIKDENYKTQGVIDDQISSIWANRFRQCGDFELKVSPSCVSIDLLKSGNMVYRRDDDMVCIIERIQLDTDEDAGDSYIITGRCLKSILDRRIVWTQTNLNDTVENCLRQLVNENAINPTDPSRKIPNLKLADAHGYTETMKKQITGDNLLSAIEEICKTYKYGFKITLDDDVMILDFYKGVDRSYAQTTNTHVVFSHEYDNLANSTYMRDDSNLKTVALVAGEGEGMDRRRIEVNPDTTLTGLKRRELYVDSRDISSNEGEITEEEYNAALTEKGNAALKENTIIEEFEGSVDNEQMYKYGVDYNVGDVVTVKNRYGMTVNTTVTEYIESCDESGVISIPTFDM